MDQYQDKKTHTELERAVGLYEGKIFTPGGLSKIALDELAYKGWVAMLGRINDDSNIYPTSTSDTDTLTIFKTVGFTPKIDNESGKKCWTGMTDLHLFHVSYFDKSIKYDRTVDGELLAISEEDKGGGIKTCLYEIPKYLVAVFESGEFKRDFKLVHEPEEGEEETGGKQE